MLFLSQIFFSRASVFVAAFANVLDVISMTAAVLSGESLFDLQVLFIASGFGS